MDETDCVVVGGGPGGAVLAYLLARAGRRVTLLEARSDFARRFRGDSLAPAVMDWLDTLGLADDVLARPHATADAFTWHTPTASYRVADYGRASARFPHYVLLPQPEFLGLLTGRAAGYPGFRLEMSARVNELVEEGGRVVGVRYRAGDGEVREVRAPLVVGADGRFSQVRRLGGSTPRSSAPGWTSCGSRSRAATPTRRCRVWTTSPCRARRSSRSGRAPPGSSATSSRRGRSPGRGRRASARWWRWPATGCRGWATASTPSPRSPT